MTRRRRACSPCHSTSAMRRWCSGGHPRRLLRKSRRDAAPAATACTLAAVAPVLLLLVVITSCTIIVVVAYTTNTSSPLPHHCFRRSTFVHSSSPPFVSERRCKSIGSAAPDNIDAASTRRRRERIGAAASNGNSGDTVANNAGHTAPLYHAASSSAVDEHPHQHLQHVEQQQHRRSGVCSIGDGAPQRSQPSPLQPPPCYYWPPANDANFFEEQMTVCRSVAEAEAMLESSSDSGSAEEEEPYSPQPPPRRQRFVEHSRYTARFGEVLLHYHNTATDSDGRRLACYNAQAVVNYVSKHGGHAKLLCLAKEVTEALESHATTTFRVKQLEEALDDITTESYDLVMNGRLYYSAIRASTPVLTDVGLTPDFLGFTVLLALLRAATSASATASANDFLTAADSSTTGAAEPFDDAAPPAMKPNHHRAFASNGGAALERVVTNHFHGIVVAPPGDNDDGDEDDSRFRFVSGVNLLEDAKTRGRAKASSSPSPSSSTPPPTATSRRQRRATQLVVSFASLGNGLIRHEFRASLVKILSSLSSSSQQSSTAVPTAAERPEGSLFDVLFVADPSQSWYQRTFECDSFEGFIQYESYIRSISTPYDQIVLIGDSMGGSGALLFAHLATDVISFVPQITLKDDPHASRDDLVEEVRERFEMRLVASVKEALRNGTNITVHRGVDCEDIRQMERLAEHAIPVETVSAEEYFGTAVTTAGGEETVDDALQEQAQGRVLVVEHPGCDHHQLSPYLKENGQLIDALRMGGRWMK